MNKWNHRRSSYTCVLQIDGQPHCIALYDFVGEIPDDLSFSCGDKILIHERVGTDWIKGELNGRTGILPAAFVNIVRDINGTKLHRHCDQKLFEFFQFFLLLWRYWTEKGGDNSVSPN